jgi:hypothetical protein
VDISIKIVESGNIQQAANDLAALAGGVLENGPYSELLPTSSEV